MTSQTSAWFSGAARMTAWTCAVVLVGLTSGCGGSDFSEAPTSAATDDFCLTWAKQALDVGEVIRSSLEGPEGQPPSGDAIADVWHAWAEEMAAVGTPEGIPSDARTGFENALDEATNMDPDDADLQSSKSQDLSDGWDDLSSDEFNAVRSLNTYVDDTCTTLYRERGLVD